MRTLQYAISLLIGLLLPSLNSWTVARAAYQRCDLDRCYSKQDADTRRRIESGETVLISDPASGSKFELNYVFKRVRNADPELAAAVFARFEEHPARLGAVVKSEVLRTVPRGAVVRYELDVSRLLDGAMGLLAGAAPNSKYAVTNTFSRGEGGTYLVWWEIEAAETAALNKKKGFFDLRAGMSKPEYINGFMLIEPLAGTADSVITYANTVALESDLAKRASGVLNQNSRVVLQAMVEKTVEWIETVGAGGDAEKASYRDGLCRILLSR